ncbi:MAG: response regulator [Candidatus Colwellbacteria bacterium]|nr:response regulator [Candidatus Colwellbacteria bacterium]
MNKTILIVEDELPLLNVLYEKFGREGFNVLKAVNGEEGLKNALSNKPDLILLDIIMPKMDGITMLRELRKDEWGKSAKVVILTNLSSATSVDEGIRHGVFTFLVKTNWKLEEVVSKVKTLLGIN